MAHQQAMLHHLQLLLQALMANLILHPHYWHLPLALRPQKGIYLRRVLPNPPLDLMIPLHQQHLLEMLNLLPLLLLMHHREKHLLPPRLQITLRLLQEVMACLRFLRDLNLPPRLQLIQIIKLGYSILLLLIPLLQKVFFQLP